MKIRYGYIEDIKVAARNILIAWGIITVIVGLVYAAISCVSNTEHSEYEVYNQFTTMTNESLDADQREKLAEWFYSAEDLDEDGFFIEREEPKTLMDMIQENWVGCVITLVGLYSLISFLVYVFSYSSSYHLADLPFKTFYGWFILIACFAGWLAFLISRINFCRFRKKCRAEQEEEKAKSDTVKLPKIDPKFDEEAFVAFCRDMLPLGKRVRRAEKTLASDEAEVNNLGRTLKETTENLKAAQLKVGQDLAKLNELRAEKDTAVLDQKTKDQILHDFAQIKGMHGVKQIYRDKDGNLAILARADYELYGTLYDIGDFILTVYDSELVATLHSNRNTSIRYCGESFCFGNRSSDIDAYVKAGRIIEAIELAITCINHINPTDVDDIPRRYKRIVN